MSIATITLSSKGQVVITKEIRDELHWDAGTRITLVSSASAEAEKLIARSFRLPMVRMAQSLCINSGSRR